MFENDLDFLSNMYLCKIKYNGKVFKSSEHLYQYLKIDDNGLWWKEKIIESEHGKIAKKLTKNKKCPLKTFKNDFQKNLFLIRNMIKCIDLKFNQNYDLHKRLLTTNDANLVEWNYWGDTFYGKDIRTENGKNYLGRILKIKKYKLIKDNLKDEITS
jgi:ribA/ribD-fused uncharacterized protein